MSPRFETVSETGRTPDETFAFVTDTRRWSSFQGYGPIPAIVRAEPCDAPAMAAGVRIRVENSDRSVHHERVDAFEPPTRLSLTMELAPPVSWILAAIREDVAFAPTDRGTRVTRRFELVPRSWLTWPLAWGIRLFLAAAVRAHDRVVADTLR